MAPVPFSVSPYHYSASACSVSVGLRTPSTRSQCPHQLNSSYSSKPCSRSFHATPSVFSSLIFSTMYYHASLLSATGSSVEYLERDSAWLSHPPFRMPHTKVCTFVNETRPVPRFKTMLLGDSTTWWIGLTSLSLSGQQADVRPSTLCDSSQAKPAPCEPPSDGASLRIPSSVMMYGVSTELCGVNNVLGGRMRRRTCVHSPSSGCPQDHEIPLLQSARRLFSSTIQLSRQCHNHCTHEPRVLSPDAEAQDVLREPLHYVWSIQDVLRLSVVSQTLCMMVVLPAFARLVMRTRNWRFGLFAGMEFLFPIWLALGGIAVRTGGLETGRKGPKTAQARQDHTIITISRSRVDCKCHPIPEMQFTSLSAIR